jgi:hypothetical protein
MRVLTAVALALPSLLASACSSQAWYEGARASAEAQCRAQPAGAYEECMSRLDQRSYEDYRREREAVKQAR